MPIKEARHLMKKIQEDFFTNKMKANKFIYAGRLKSRPVTEKEVLWVRRNADGGLLPVVAPDANSPVGTQGDYREFKAQAVYFREIIPFSLETLQNIVSKDVNVRITAKSHIQFEVQNQMMKAMNTRELIAHSIIGRAAFRYSRMGGGMSININRTFPIKTRTVSTSWSNLTTATIVTDLNTFIDEYEIRVGSKPDFIRMGSRLFNNQVKTNTEVRAIYSNSFTGFKRPEDYRGGYLTTDDVSKANGWPPIELHSERYHVQYTVKTAVSAGSNVLVDLNEGTFGLFVGDEVLIGFGHDSDGNTTWTEKQTIGSVNHGKGIGIDTVDAAITAGTVIAARPTYFPRNRIVLGKNETETSYLEPPFGITATGGGNITFPNWRGIKADAYMDMTEPNLTVYRRIWDAFGMQVNVDNYETIQVLL